MENVHQTLKEIIICDYLDRQYLHEITSGFSQKLKLIYPKPAEQRSDFFESYREFNRRIFTAYLEKKLEMVREVGIVMAYYNPDYLNNPVPAHLTKGDIPDYYYACKFWKYLNKSTSNKNADFLLNTELIKTAFSDIDADKNTYFFDHIYTMRILEFYVDFKIQQSLLNKFIPATQRGKKTNLMYFFSKELKEYHDNIIRKHLSETSAEKLKLNAIIKKSFYAPLHEHLEKLCAELQLSNPETASQYMMKETFETMGLKDVREFERKYFPMLMKTLVLNNEERALASGSEIKPVKFDSNTKKLLLLKILEVINPSITMRSESEHNKKGMQSSYYSYKVDYFNRLVLGK